jgi:hypothetical protein
VTNKNAFLFTDGRYFLQAEKQLDKSAVYDQFPSSNLLTCISQELDFDEKWPSRSSDLAGIPLEGEFFYRFRLIFLPTTVKDIEKGTRIGIDASLISAGNEYASYV